MPTPVQLAATAQTDASGNATISRIIRAAYWTAIYATGQAAGAGAWVLGPAGTPIAFQSGANVVLGPIFLSPGETATLQLTGATPNTTVTVTFWGFQGAAADGSDLPALVPSVETAGSLLGIIGPVTIGSGSVAISGNVPVVNAPGTQLSTQVEQRVGPSFVVPGDGAPHTQVLAIAAGVRSFALTLGPNHNNVLGITCTGNNTGVDYAQSPPFNTGFQFYPQLFWFPVLYAQDTQVTVSITNGSGKPAITVTATAILDNEVETINPSLPQQNVLFAPNFNQIIAAEAGLNPPGNTIALATTHVYSNAAPWEAALHIPVQQTFSLAAGAAQVLIPAPAAGSRIFLHEICFQLPTGIAGCFGQYEQPGGPSYCSVDLGQPQSRNYSFRGAALAAASALQFRNTSATAMTATVNGSIIYSVAVAP